MWDLRAGRLAQLYADAHPGGGTCLDFHPGGAFLLSGGHDGALKARATLQGGGGEWAGGGVWADDCIPVPWPAMHEEG